MADPGGRGHEPHLLHKKQFGAYLIFKAIFQLKQKPPFSDS